MEKVHFEGGKASFWRRKRFILKEEKVYLKEKKGYFEGGMGSF